MFWVRGVLEFFTADDARMVPAGGLSGASRQFAARIVVCVFEPRLDVIVLLDCCSGRRSRGQLTQLGQRELDGLPV